MYLEYYSVCTNTKKVSDLPATIATLLDIYIPQKKVSDLPATIATLLNIYIPQKKVSNLPATIATLLKSYIPQKKFQICLLQLRHFWKFSFLKKSFRFACYTCDTFEYSSLS